MGMPRPRSRRGAWLAVGASSCVLEHRRATGERLPDLASNFLISVGCDPKQPIADTKQEIALPAGRRGNDRKAIVIVTQWRVKLSDMRLAGYASISALASAADANGLTTYYRERSVSPFAVGAGELPLHAKPSALRRVKWRECHAPEEREAKLFAQLQLASVWANAALLPTNWRDELPSWLAILERWRSYVRQQSELQFVADCGEYAAQFPDCEQGKIMEILLEIRQTPPIMAVMGFGEKDQCAEGLPRKHNYEVVFQTARPCN